MKPPTSYKRLIGVLVAVALGLGLFLGLSLIVNRHFALAQFPAQPAPLQQSVAQSQSAFDEPELRRAETRGARDAFDISAAPAPQSPELILWVNYDHNWVQGPYEVGHTAWLTVTNSSGVIKATAEVVTAPDPNGSPWTGFNTSTGNPWQPEHPNIQPGDFVYGSIDTGYTATVQVGQITGVVDADTDSITGAVDVPWLMPGPVDIECHPWGAPGGAPWKYDQVTPDGNDAYACAWDPNTEWDVQPGQDIAVIYREPATGHLVYGVFEEPVYDLILQVNYAHDWVQGPYEAGHTVWLTVTNALGEIKATAQLSTGETPWGWNGFATHVGSNPWQPQQPDIQPGDFVYGAVSTGYTATVQLGQITGFVDPEADTITGTVEASWLLPGPLDVQCHPWGAPGGAPGKSDTVMPDGSDAYACSWDPDTEWDVQPGQDIAVSYHEPAGHEIFDVYRAPVWDLILDIDTYDNWIEGNYEPGYTVWLTVTNNLGELKAVARMDTGEVPWWGGRTGFSTNDGNPWHPRRPDIQAGDWIYGAVNSGYTATVQLGEITGEVNVDADFITGTVAVPWLLPGPVEVECQPRIWPDWAPNKQTTVIPDGSDVYTCAWNPDTEWDIGPGQRIGVSYREPAGHRIHNVFRSPILEIHYKHNWVEGEYEPGHTVWITVTNASGTVKATATMTTAPIDWWDGRPGFSTNWGDPWQPERPDIQPNDWVLATTDDGWNAAVQIGQITGDVELETNRLVGTVNAPWIATHLTHVQCNPPYDANRRVQEKHDWIYPDGVDTYVCAWDPDIEWEIQPGEEINVFYDDVAGHRIHDIFYEPRYDLILDISYVHDWIEGNYEPGYTVWLTVTNNVGAIKATITLETDVIPWWGERTGFSTNLDDNLWQPWRPDIEPGDIIYGMVNNGYSATVQVGRITGFIDVDADTITGTVDAPWLAPEVLEVQCEPWIWPNWAPGKSDTVLPDGSDPYACAWNPATEWDIQWGDHIGVSYREPDGHRIWNGFRATDYGLYFTTNYDADRIEGPYEPGYTVWLTVTNSSGAFKAMVELHTEDWGFSSDNGEWQPERPDIVPGDWIYGAVDNGYTAATRVAEITGALDIAADSITGAVNAAWLLPGPVDLECLAWDAPELIPHKVDYVTPNGSDPYLCAWNPTTEWDIKPGQNVAVMLHGPDGHRVVRLFGVPLEPPAYTLDAIVVETEPSLSNAITRLEAGELALYAQPTNNPDVVAQIAASPNLTGYLSYGSYNELTFNPSGPIFAGTGKLNPFAVPRIREALNWLVNRQHIQQEIMGGMSRPRWLPLNTASRDYAALADVARALELQYAYDQVQAQQVIAQEMLNLPGVTRVGGQWRYNNAPVEIIVLIRVEDQRRAIGDYVSDQLETLGFTVIREYKTAGQASPIWIHGDPAEGRFHIYTGGWISTEVPRDLSDNFAFFYTNMGLDFPLWQAYTPTPEFYELARQLREREFSTLEERRAMMAQALEWALEDSVHLWLHDNLSLTPRRAEVRYASDLYGGISGSWMWPHTLERTGSFAAPLTIGIPALFQEPWNPLDGSAGLYDMTFIRATSDNGVIPDPYTGLAWPQRIASAQIVAQTGLPIFKTHNWVTLQFAPTIAVPGGAWAGWNAATQQFLTVDQVYGEPQTARIKSTVTYPANLFTSVTWHDGSPFSLADIVMHIILNFDRDLTDVKAVRIVSQNPLVIETYTDAYQIDAELNVAAWWPTYRTGPGAWHALALGLLVEEAQEGAFSQWQADEWGAPWLDYAAWPGIIPLERKLASAQAANYIPYAPTLSAYITPAQATARWNALAAWHAARGHFWVGTGPLYLEHALKPIGQLSLKPYAAYPDPPDRWDAFLEAPLAEVAITGPESVAQGAAATFDAQVTLNGAPYPTADIESVRYLLRNAQNQLAFTGDATAVSNGLWRVTLTPAMSTQLPLGGNELEVIVVSRRVAVSAFATHDFETTGMRVLSVTPSSGVNNTSTALTIGGRQFQAGAIASLLRDGAAQQLVTTYLSQSTLQATAPAGLQSGTYALRVINPSGEMDTLLGAFTVLSPTPPVITSINPQQGPNNIPVTLDIYGSNFAPGLTARLGTTPLEGLYFINSTHIRAVAPLNMTPGVYTLTVANPNGQSAQLSNAYTVLASIHDLYPRSGSFWLDPVTLRQGNPVTPTLGIVVNRLGGTAGLPNVPVDFYYQTSGGNSVYIGRANTPALAPDSQAATAPLAWANLPAAGTYTLRAVIDPANTIPETVETNNVLTRTVTILPPLPDTIPPVVQSFRINSGEQQTAQQQVAFNLTAQDNPGGSGIAHVLYIEYIYIYSRGDWVPVASSGWLPYAEAASNYPWQLSPAPGIHYIRAWAADAAGNISLYWRAGFINLVPVPTTPPTAAPIARGQIHTYRFYFQTGQGLALTLNSVSGDADVYVFGPDDGLIAYSFSENPTEGLSFTATRNGIYQVEVFGYHASTYTLQVTLSGGAQTHAPMGAPTGVSNAKTPRTEPLVSAVSDPTEATYAVGVPSAPVTPTAPPCVAVTGVSFTTTPGKPLVNAPLTFNAVLGPVGATTPITYTWTFGDGQSATGNAASIQHTYTSAGNKNVQVRVANPCTPAGMTAQQTIAVELRKIYLPLVMRNAP